MRKAILAHRLNIQRDSAPSNPTIPIRILRQVLLVIILGVIKLRRLQDLGGDLAVAGLGQTLLIRLLSLLRGGTLFVVVEIDAGAILSADVVALAHAVGRVV